MTLTRTAPILFVLLGLLAACATPATKNQTTTPDPAETTGPALDDLAIFDACRRDMALGLGVFYLCEHLQFGAFISESFPWTPETQAENLDRFARTVGERIHGKAGQVTVEATTFDMLDVQAPMVNYQATGMGMGPDFMGKFVAAPASQGARVVSCITTGDWKFDRCNEIIRLLAPERTFKALSARYKSSSPVFAGRPLEVMSGCQKTSARTITCDRSELAVSPVPNADDIKAANMEMQADQKLFMGELCKEPSVWSVPCKLDGAETMCHIGLCSDDLGALQSIVTMARVRDQAYAASCRHDPSQGKALPPVCAQVIELPEDALIPPAQP